MVGQWLADCWPTVGEWLANGWALVGEWLASTSWHHRLGPWTEHGAWTMNRWTTYDKKFPYKKFPFSLHIVASSFWTMDRTWSMDHESTMHHWMSHGHWTTYTTKSPV